MGNVSSSLVRSTILSAVATNWSKPCRILVLGLDGAGKTTILNKLKIGGVVTTIPAIGFSVESFKYKKIEFVSWDIRYKSGVRSLWTSYMENTSAVIFVVDAADRSRVAQAAEELRNLFRSEELRDAPLLVFANKQDQHGCMSNEEIKDQLKLEDVNRNPHHIEATVATTGEGLFDGLDWLRREIQGV